MRTLKIIFIAIAIILISILSWTGKTESSGLYRYLIVISVNDFKITLWQINGSQKEIQSYTKISSYPIGAPTKDYYLLPMTGEIERIELNPYWYPTANIRLAYLQDGEILPLAIKPGDPRNAMGKVKFIIKFKNFNEPVRIHGTNQTDSIGKRSSYKCIRMFDSNAMEIAKIIKNSLTKIIIKE
ncbi:MAG: L,D-transpeptidase [Nitrospirota bacterium]